MNEEGVIRIMQNRGIQIGSTIPLELYTYLEERRKEEGITLSALVRNIIEEKKKQDSK